MKFAYLHGLASSPASYKASKLGPMLAEYGHTLHVPNLNVPSFSRLTYGGALSAITTLVADEGPNQTWRFVGSSMGGYLAARWAAEHPDRVDRLLLLCPGFDMVRRWPTILGEEAIETWKREGELPLPDATGTPVPVHYRLFEEAQSEPQRPAVPCPTRIIHGTRDEIVPIENSRRYVEENPLAELVEVDDAHDLTATLPRIIEETRSYLLPRMPATRNGTSGTRPGESA